MSVDELEEALERDRDGVLLLDCRRRDEYDVSRLDGAVFVGEEGELAGPVISDFAARRRGREAKICCYCSVGYRSARLVKSLSKAGVPDGISDVYNVRGSLFRWANSGKRMVGSDGCETSLVHPYNSVFGAMLDADRRSKIE